jgi:branched-chain amino acid aminotransferase
MMTMDDKDGVIWLDGKWVEWREAKVHVLTHTLHYGLGVFEGIRAYHAEKGTAIFRMQEHTDRLFRSAHIMNMKMPYGKEELNQVQRDAVAKNNLDSAYIRSMCFLGSEGMGLRADNLKYVAVAMVVGIWGRKASKKASVSVPHRIPVTITTAPCVRPKPTAITSILS